MAKVLFPEGARLGNSLCRNPRIVIFFSLTEAPLTDPTPTPPNTPETDPKRTRNGAETEPNGAERSQTEPKWTEIKPSRVGRTGGFVGKGGVGVVREKEYHYPRRVIAEAQDENTKKSTVWIIIGLWKFLV